MRYTFEEEFRLDYPETVGETDRNFDLDNYKDWLEAQLKEALKFLERAKGLVGNPGTNISVSTDIACDEWHKDYDVWKS